MAQEKNFEEGKAPIETIDEVAINPSGHREELDRQFSTLSLCGLAVSSGNTWIALGGTITVAIYNGGPPGVIYEFIAASVMYWLIAASIAELASAMPSSGGVYHWASVTGGRYGRVWGWFAGWWNFAAWIYGLAGSAQIVAAQTVSMYGACHPEYTTQRWHIFIAYLGYTWLCASVLLFWNSSLPKFAAMDGILVVVGVLVTIVVCAVLPGSNAGYATSDFVWREWVNSTGYESNGFVFLLGMLNGAFTVGTPDVVTHLAEEIKRPSKTIPKAILCQFIVGFITAFTYVIAISYSISDLDSVLESPYLNPLASIYLQATNSGSGAAGLLFLAFLPFLIGMLGTFITASRIFWTLARDNATPFSSFFSEVHPRFRNPFNAIVLCAVLNTLLGCIYIGSATAFNAFVGSFVVLSCLSYLAAILPHLLSRRASIVPGWFWMKGPTGFVINGIACSYIIVFTVIFCFPFSMPVTAATMNYSSLMSGGITVFVTAFWFWRQKEFAGPKYVPPTAEALAADAM